MVMVLREARSEVFKLKTIGIGQNIYLSNSYLSTVYIQILSNVPEYLSTRISIVDVLEMPYDLYIRLHRHLSTQNGFSHIGIWRPASLSSLPSTCENEIMMEAAEIDVLKAFLHPEVVMFEFGSGVSSLVASPKRSPSKKAPMIEPSRAVSMWDPMGRCPTSNTQPTGFFLFSGPQTFLKS